VTTRRMPSTICSTDGWGSLTSPAGGPSAVLSAEAGKAAAPDGAGHSCAVLTGWAVAEAEDGGAAGAACASSGSRMAPGVAAYWASRSSS